MAKFTHGYRHNTDMDTNRKMTQTDWDRDINGQGHKRTGTGTQVDRDWGTD
jgi:hypothetical protein